MQIKTYTVYKFHELTKEQQQKVLNNYRDWNIQGEWWGFVYEDYQEKLATFGFLNADISFSGFGSQGDGASFTSENIDIEKFISKFPKESVQYFKPLIKKYKDILICKVKRTDSRYVHENTCSADISFPDLEHTPEDETIANDLESLINVKRKELSIEIYKALQSEYEYLTSDDALIEFWNENSDYQFTDDGKIDN